MSQNQYSLICYFMVATGYIVKRSRVLQASVFLSDRSLAPTFDSYNNSQTKRFQTESTDQKLSLSLLIHTYTHTHTHIYIYIYIYEPVLLTTNRDMRLFPGKVIVLL